VRTSGRLIVPSAADHPAASSAADPDRGRDGQIHDRPALTCLAQPCPAVPFLAQPCRIPAYSDKASDGPPGATSTTRLPLLSSQPIPAWSKASFSASRLLKSPAPGRDCAEQCLHSVGLHRPPGDRPAGAARSATRPRTARRYGGRGTSPRTASPKPSPTR